MRNPFNKICKLVFFPFYISEYTYKNHINDERKNTRLIFGLFKPEGQKLKFQFEKIEKMKIKIVIS